MRSVIVSPSFRERTAISGVGQVLEPGATAMDVFRILLAILVPPLGVFLQVGIGLQFWLNILLTLLGYIPGLIHAIWVIQRR
jgi:uncharacterized membrane protein YqaE (UPF0057 family)